MTSRRWVRAGKGHSTQRLITDFQPQSRSRVDATSINVVWYKWSDLRLLDHEPLVRAHSKGKHVLHVHLVELPLLAGQSRVGRVPRCSERRAAFWREAVTDLSKQLEDKGQHLMVCSVSKAADFFSTLCQRYQVSSVFAHREFCDEEIKVEAE
eukprot:CAMPEP_0169162170 /NCGR_PEP_ID=MMETSP1015-20121227/57494_1 /TAXON_ID=342587 /ORGANISM="Karlodinium micrum, Strain CCMP2283" /LENGTH=152 /DNA_ID=CAMNT_0009234193 /DNA_START=22 /DNA_END=477 /DNA_ORIENTATION=-